MNKNQMLGRLMSKVETRGRVNNNMSPCWISLGIPSSTGYGQIYLNGKAWNTHRLSWWLHNDCPDLSPKDQILHSCDNPICCNPEHLTRGTATQNAIECIERIRVVKEKRVKKPVSANHYTPDWKGEKNPKSKLTETQITEIKRRRDAGLKYGDLKKMAEEFKVSYIRIQQIVAK